MADHGGPGSAGENGVVGEEGLGLAEEGFGGGEWRVIGDAEVGDGDGHHDERVEEIGEEYASDELELRVFEMRELEVAVDGEEERGGGK